MRLAARALEAAAALLALLLLVVLTTGGVRLGAFPLTRAEDVVLALVVVAAARALVAPLALPSLAPGRTVVGGAVLYTVLLGFIAVTRHRTLQSHALDLGYYVQVLWSIAHGFGARVTLPPMHAWGDHFSPVLYLLAPLGWVTWTAAGLLFVQTVILAAGALAVFGFARQRLADDRLAAGLALLYLVNPSLHGVNVRDVHPQAFAIPLLIGAALAFDARRWGWCAAALVLTAGCREDATVALVGFAIWLALARGRWTLGLALAVLAVSALVLDTRLLMPHFRGEPYPHLIKRYSHLGASVPDLLLTLLLRPWRWLPVVLSGAKVVYLLAMLAPLAFLPLLAPLTLAAALPGLAMNLLSFDPILINYRTQYQVFVLPFFMLAAVEGAAVLQRWTAAGWLRWQPRAALVAAALVSIALTARTVNDLAVTRWRLTPSQRAARALMAGIPGDAAVSVNERLMPHLARRRESYVYDLGVARSEFVLDLDSVLARRPPPGRFSAIARSGGWSLLQRRDDSPPAASPGRRAAAEERR